MSGKKHSLKKPSPIQGVKRQKVKGVDKKKTTCDLGQQELF